MSLVLPQLAQVENSTPLINLLLAHTNDSSPPTHLFSMATVTKIARKNTAPLSSNTVPRDWWHSEEREAKIKALMSSKRASAFKNLLSTNSCSGWHS